MQKRILAAVLGVAALAAASCSNESNRENQTYRWIGFLVDGSTATPLALKDDAKSTNQVYAVIKGEVRRAKPCEGSDDPATKLPGCFVIEDIPVSYIEDTGQTVDQIPVFAQYDGYQRFQGQLSGLASVSTEHVSEILDMQLYANIRLFPTDYQVPYRVQTNFNGRPVSDVRVVCQVRNATADKFATSGSDFLDPEDTLGGVVDVNSDGSGSANLPGPLVNGATYHCYATRADAFEGNIVQGTLDFTAGVSAANQTINLTAAPGMTLYAVSTNNEDPGVTLGSSGQLLITFNRPIEIVPGTADCQFASLSAPNTNGDSNTAGALPATVANNGASEQVQASVSADGLTLTLGFKPGSPGLDPNDLGSAVTFSGIFIRPAGAEPAYIYRIGSTAGAGTSACSLGTAYGLPPSVVDVHTGTVSPSIRLF
ncbi:MAG: hypothetical protein ACXU86_06535 [Archangium sp.]